MEHDRETGNAALDFLEDVEAEGGRQEDAVGVARALLGLELGSAVARADGYGQGVNAGLLDEILDLVGLGVVRVLGRNIVFHAGQHAQFALYGYVILTGMGVLADFLRQSDVFFVRQVGTVYHYAGEAVLYAVDAEFKRVAVVEVQHYRYLVAEFGGILDGATGHVA